MDGVRLFMLVSALDGRTMSWFGLATSLDFPDFEAVYSEQENGSCSWRGEEILCCQSCHVPR